MRSVSGNDIKAHLTIFNTVLSPDLVFDPTLAG